MILDKVQMEKVLSLFPDTAEVEIYDTYTKRLLTIGSITLDLENKSGITLRVSSAPELERVPAKTETLSNINGPFDFEIHVDGSCDLKKRIGAYAYIIMDRRAGKNKFLVSETEWCLDPNVTSQRMEVKAALAAIWKMNGLGVENEGTIAIFSDSKYLIETMKGNFRVNSNRDLFTALTESTSFKQCEWYYLSDENSELLKKCHELAFETMAKKREHIQRMGSAL